MLSIEKTTTNTIVIKKSQFITTLIPCSDINEAKVLINNVKNKYHDATHNCVAYIIGSNEKAEDNGEPSGTAGMPMLNVLKMQKLTNIIVIVTRYFGGIKLGAGGLTRAYTNSVVEALKKANIVEKELVKKYLVTIDYSFTKKIEYLFKINNIDILNTNYNDKVTYEMFIRDENIFDQIQEITSNNYQHKVIGEDYIPTLNNQ
ncbi:MAG: YigZ family protein [Thomasclavelia sp.]|nr:YigZ family protein [Thomasclavelia sp.]